MAASRLLIALLAVPLAVACASPGDDDAPDEGTRGDDQNVNAGLRLGELGGMCGGIAAIRCKAGLECKITAQHPDASGTCVEVKEVSLEGTLRATQGRGETTGYGIEVSGKLHELVLQEHEKAWFLDGQLAQVKGKETQIASVVDRPARTAVDVSEIFSCPKESTIDCMPPFMPAQCSPAARAWIQSKCDVSFTD